MRTYTCALCGEEAGFDAPYAGVTIPPEFLKAMHHSETVETDNIAGKVRVDWCRSCKNRLEIVVEAGDSPLPACDARQARFDRADVFAALVDEGKPPEAYQRDDLASRMVEDALSVVAIAKRGNADHLLPSTVFEARIIVLTARELSESTDGGPNE